MIDWSADANTCQVHKRLQIITLILVTMVGLWLFAKPYWTDKNAVVVLLIEKFAQNGGVTVTEFPCFLTNPNSIETHKTLSTWGEEPPLFHYMGVGLKKLGFENQYPRMLSLLFYLLTIAGLVSVFGFIVPESKGQILPWMIFLFTPALTVHAARLLPDWLMLAALIWGVYFLFRDKLPISFLLFALAITQKALAAFAIVPILIAYLYFRDRWSWTKAFIFLAGLLAACLPIVLWLYYLKSNGIQNPFFSEGTATHHMGGSHFSVLLDPRYWERFWMWNFRNGTSVVLMAAAFSYIYRVKSQWSALNWQTKAVIVWALSVVGFWIVVRGTQATAPWYSFSFIIAWALLGAAGLYRWPSKWRFVAVALLICISLERTGLTLDPTENLRFRISSTPVGLNCPEAWLKP